MTLYCLDLLFWLGVGDEWLPTLSEMLNPGFLKGEDYDFLFFPLKMNVW